MNFVIYFPTFKLFSLKFTPSYIINNFYFCLFSSCSHFQFANPWWNHKVEWKFLCRIWIKELNWILNTILLGFQYFQIVYIHILIPQTTNVANTDTHTLFSRVKAHIYKCIDVYKHSRVPACIFPYIENYCIPVETCWHLYATEWKHQIRGFYTLERFYTFNLAAFTTGNFSMS